DRWYVRGGIDGKGTPTPETLVQERMSAREARVLAEFWRNACVPTSRLAYPSASVELGEVHARILLATVLESKNPGIANSIQQFAEAFPDARGRMGGREVNYAEFLTT